MCVEQFIKILFIKQINNHRNNLIFLFNSFTSFFGGFHDNKFNFHIHIKKMNKFKLRFVWITTFLLVLKLTLMTLKQNHAS